MFYYTILAFVLLFFSDFLDALTIQIFSSFDNFFEVILSGEIGQNSCLYLYNQLFLLSSLPFIPWKITSSSVSAQNALIRFYSWLPEKSPVKLFIDTHCLHLLKSDPGFLGKEHSGIPSSLFTVDSMLSDSKLKDCAKLRTPENAFDEIDSSYISPAS
jgi:hypothetical protein